MEIFPSIFGADLMHLQEQIDELEQNDMAYLHVDMMDGNYVPNIAFGPNQIAAIKNGCKKMKVDVHMMLNPEFHLSQVIASGADMISVHYESTKHIHYMIQTIKNSGLKAGVVLNPGTPVCMLNDLIDDVDYVLLMTINPGRLGQSFLPMSLNRIKELKKLIGSRDIKIQVDGGINVQNIKMASDAGADWAVVGRYIFNGNIPEKINSLKIAMNGGMQ